MIFPRESGHNEERDGTAKNSTGGKHRQWKDENGNIVRRYDKGVAGSKGWRGRDHWHDEQDNHIPPGGY